jgi:GcrA cell cycle regulator
MKPTILTPELATTLTQLWEAGETGVYIERRLGITRDAIARFVRELGLTPRNVASPWSDARVETLKKLWGEGVSASQIASQLGLPTRNAVISKIHRLGLQRNEVGATISLNNRIRKAPRKTRGHKADQPHAWQILPPEQRPDPHVVRKDAWAPLPGSKPVPTSELKSSHCRWPIDVPGENVSRHCGCFAVGTYCEAHANRAYSSAKTKAKVDDRLGISRARRAA